MRAFILGIISLLALPSCSRPEGDAYSKGIDAYSRKQYTEAEPFIRQAAERGHVDGMSILGVMYLFGQGIPADGNQAEYWLMKAARGGSIDAQSILGIMYATGQGVKRNLPEAKKWLERASREGDKHAKEMLTLIRGKQSGR